mgnify:CR=1 FL=1
MAQNRYQAHIGKTRIVLNQSASDGGHKVASNETKLRLAITLAQSSHQMGCMQIATGFTSYQIIVQNSEFKLLYRIFFQQFESCHCLIRCHIQLNRGDRSITVVKCPIVGIRVLGLKILELTC